ncbi:hypothetical protein KQH82_07135 [bacterium]|nr:hypothetical protein [bacterium]
MRRLLLTFLILIAPLFAVSGDDSDTTIVVIANRAAPDTALDRGALLDFYTGDIQAWSDGTRVRLFDLEGHKDVRDRFFDYLGKTSSRMRSIWLKNMLSGEGHPPDALSDEEAVVRQVAATPGAIGFVTRAHVGDSVKVLLTISE